jgi:hypothetical protein
VNIRETMAPKLQAREIAHLAKMRQIGAPDLLIKTLEDKLAASDPCSQIGKVKMFGDREVLSATNKSYRRGQGAEFETPQGKVWMIPGPYGLFLTDQPR